MRYALLQCDGWFVATLDPATMPTDLYSHALLERVTTPSLPESGASRPGALMAETACRTEMTPTGEDPLECWTLLFDHCISGYTSRNRVPRSILQNELQASCCCSCCCCGGCIGGWRGGWEGRGHPAAAHSRRPATAAAAALA